MWGAVKKKKPASCGLRFNVKPLLHRGFSPCDLHGAKLRGAQAICVVRPTCNPTKDWNDNPTGLVRAELYTCPLYFFTLPEGSAKPQKLYRHA
jgi:hypothetical protein